MDYKISVEDTSSVGKNINIDIPRAVLQEKVGRALQRASSSVQLKGFRKGRAPQALVERLYGERIRSDVMGEIVNEAYEAAVREHTLRIVGTPQISVEDGDEDKDVRVTAIVAIFPEPQVAGYTRVAFEAEKHEFTEESLEKALEQLRERFAGVEAVEGRTVVEAGDIVVADFKGTVDGEPFQGSDGDGVQVELGSGRSLPGVEDALLGGTIGEEKEVETVLPDNAGEELAGKAANYKVSIRGIMRKTLPELNDEFAKNAGAAGGIDELRLRLSERLQDEVERKNRSAKEEGFFGALIEKNPFEIPPALIDEEMRNVMFEMGWLDPAKKESYQYDLAPFRETLGKQAEFRVRRNVILGRIVRQESIQSSDEEVDQWLDKVAERAKEPREKINEWWGYPSRKDRIREVVSRDRILEKLLADAVITEKTAGSESAEGASNEPKPTKKKREKKTKE